MDQVSIFAATLGLCPPWQVTTITLAQGENRLDISVIFDSAARINCPECGEAVAPRPGATETWYHNDFFRHPTYLSAQIPSLICLCGKTLSVERPWSRNGSLFSRLS